MKNLIVLSFVYLLGIGLLLAFNELNYRRLGVKGEISRKFAHFVATLATIPFPYIFPSHWYVLVLSLFFFVVLFITQQEKLLKSIHGIERKSAGSYLLPLAIYLIFLISNLLHNKFLYILPMLILAVCDPMAAILGMNIKNYNGHIRLWNHKFEKTWLGSSAFFFTGLIISIIALYFHHNVFDLKTFWLALLIAIASTAGELFSWRGSDNLTIPLSIVIVLLIFL